MVVEVEVDVLEVVDVVITVPQVGPSILGGQVQLKAFGSACT